VNGGVIMVVNKWKFLVCFLACLGFTVIGQAKTVQLAKPVVNKSISLNRAIQKRRSMRKFTSKGLTLGQISQLLWAAQGITDFKTGFRTAPSAGALYPLEVYMVKSDGVWHYLAKKHAIEQVGEQDLREKIAKAAFGQMMIAQAPVVFVIAGDFKREMVKYGSRGMLYTYIEVGNASENLLLETVSLGLAAVPVGGFSPNEVKKILNLPVKQTPLLLIPVGYASL
jgi:SagB-type dehydrogenase family enzyme